MNDLIFSPSDRQLIRKTDVLMVRTENGQLGRIEPDGTVVVCDPLTGEEKHASWEEAVALFVFVAKQLHWEPTN